MAITGKTIDNAIVRLSLLTGFHIRMNWSAFTIIRTCFAIIIGRFGGSFVQKVVGVAVEYIIGRVRYWTNVYMQII